MAAMITDTRSQFGDFSVVGCDGSFCEDADTQTAYPLDDLPNVSFCSICWTREMNRRKRTGQGAIIPFPGSENGREVHVPHLKYPGFDSQHPLIEKIRRITPRLLED